MNEHLHIVRRRTTLVVPASDAAKVAKAHDRGADAVVFDLEDGVALSAKAEARLRLGELSGGAGLCAIRINSGLNELYDDVAAAVASGACQEIVLPKVRSRVDVVRADAWIGECEQKAGRAFGTIGLGVQVENVDAVANLAAIATSSCRITSLIFGPLDFAASAGGVSIDGDLANAARMQVVMAAAKAGVAAIDGPSFELVDMKAVADQAKRASELGFSGAWTIHPAQIQPVGDAFTPTPDEISRARRVVAKMTKAHEQATGASRADGEMVDQASVAWAHSILRRA